MTANEIPSPENVQTTLEEEMEDVEPVKKSNRKGNAIVDEDKEMVEEQPTSNQQVAATIHVYKAKL